MNGPAWWPGYLLNLYVTGRLSPGWGVLFNLHDDEDKDYFEMLEEYYQTGKLVVQSW